MLSIILEEQIMTYLSDKVLKINLLETKLETIKIEEPVLREYIGGCALGAKFLYEEVSPTIEWHEPKNALIILGGQLTGTKMPGSGGFNITTKSATTNGAAQTQAQGVFGAYMRLCGYLGLIISEKSKNWCYIVIREDGSVGFRSANHLLGKDTWDTIDEICTELDRNERDLSVLTIGPAGENLVRFSCITADKGHTAAHNGVGAIMGSKKLKAIVVLRSKNKVAVKNKERLNEVVKVIVKSNANKPESPYHYGTIPGFHNNYKAGNLPIKNYKSSKWDISKQNFEKFTGKYITEHYSPKRKRPCWHCPNRHATVLTIPNGPYKGMEVEEPDYEQLAALGSNIGVDDLNEVLVLANLVDRLGMDVNETGWTLSFLIECYEKEIVTVSETNGIDLKWGDTKAIKKILEMIAERRSIGKILAEGVMRATKMIGEKSQEIGIYTSGGTTPRSHDHRARWTELFDNCVSESGTLDNTPLGIDLKKYGLSEKMNPRSFEPNEVVEMEVKMKGGMQLEDSCVICRFNTRMNLELVIKAVQAVTGWDFTEDEAKMVGKRAVNIMRAFNIRTGSFSKPNRPSIRYGSTPLDGPGSKKSFVAHFDHMLQKYYKGMGWNSKGIPLADTLIDLNLGWLVKDICNKTEIS